MGFDKKFIKQYTSEKIFTASHFGEICLFCNCKWYLPGLKTWYTFFYTEVQTVQIVSRPI